LIFLVFKETFMTQPLTPAVRQDLLARGFSRRHFGRIAALIGGSATLPFFNEAAMAAAALVKAPGPYDIIPSDVVRIHGNESPWGPCPEALEAVTSISKHANRYQPGNETQAFVAAVAETEGLKPENVSVFAGSSDPMYRISLAFTSPTKSLVMAQPGYESPGRSAEYAGAKVHRVPLRADYSHDVRAMVAADPNAGLFYICNPNNPTGTLTSKADIEWLLENKPKGSVLLLDEAYIHFSEAERGSPLVAADKDVIVLRTFSKAYAMAGMRLGLALGRRDLIAKMMPYGASLAIPITAVAAGTASIRTPAFIPERRRMIAESRESVFNFLEQKKFSYIPSNANFFLLETGRPGAEFGAAMLKEKIAVGRTWPVWPTKVRVSIGTKEEMQRFQTALTKVMA
jgi:histidinol-phosphate aminotransferase